MYVACSTLCFSKLGLDGSLKTIRDLRFAKADLALHETGTHWKPSEIVTDVPKYAAKLKASNVSFAAFHLDFDSLDGDNVREHFRACCRLARLLSVPVVTVPAAPLGSDVDQEVARLQHWVGLATAEGVILTVETNHRTLTANVADAVELCKRVPQLGLTLDPSHYMAHPNQADSADPVYPYVRHVRLRDSGTKLEEFQLRIGQGMLEHGRVINQLERHDYDRALTVDVRDHWERDFPVEPEVRKLKFLLESMV